MITSIDSETGEVTVRDGGREERFSLASREGFAAAARAWLRATWDSKYVYSFTWLGRPIIQLPDDMIRLQEVIWTTKPDIIIETGVAHGGSLIFYASLFDMIGKGRVVGIDIEIRPHNREAIEEHPLKRRIELIEGSSTDPAVVEAAAKHIRPGDSVMVILDSNHTRDHVLGELRAYGPLVTKGQYIVATDGIMALVAGGPRTGPDWSWNNPQEAARQFAKEDKRFVIEEPAWLFNEGVAKDRVSYWPDAYLKRVA